MACHQRIRYVWLSGDGGLGGGGGDLGHPPLSIFPENTRLYWRKQVQPNPTRHLWPRPVQLGGEPCQATSFSDHTKGRKQHLTVMTQRLYDLPLSRPFLSFLPTAPALGVTASCAPPPSPPPNTHKKQRRPQHMHVLVCDYQVLQDTKDTSFSLSCWT